MSWQAPQGSTRKRNTPENAGHRPFPESAFSGVLRFRVCFGALLEGNKRAPENAAHPKTQILETVDSAFSGVLRFRVLFVLL